MVDRRAVLKSGAAVTFGMLALGAVESGMSPALAADQHPATGWVPLPDPATGGVVSPPFPQHLTSQEQANLTTFDELDFQVFSHAQWARLSESHARNVRAHWPDGHYTDGLDKHAEDLAALFVWAPDTRIEVHPLRVAKDNPTAVTGVMKGTFTRPMPDDKGGSISPTGKKYALNMATVGIWNRHGTMDEEFLFWDNSAFYQQIGLG
ncbi:ester cyclase [Pseudonocardia xinjiangensis]|uniref:Ester cyclase n=1 Tax=Pseudonocardia xinjiangensis TaxID=75289 RepID=A0ABX1RJM4_9PSEU|nr:ester cyclase [Pseudonocardia xinjiangensis]